MGVARFGFLITRFDVCSKPVSADSLKSVLCSVRYFAATLELAVWLSRTERRAVSWLPSVTFLVYAIVWLALKEPYSSAHAVGEEYCPVWLSARPQLSERLF